MFRALPYECPHHLVGAFLQDRLPSPQPPNGMPVGSLHVPHIRASSRKGGLWVDSDTTSHGAVQPQTLSLVSAQAASRNLLDLLTIKSAMDPMSVSGEHPSAHQIDDMLTRSPQNFCGRSSSNKFTHVAILASKHQKRNSIHNRIR
jgi:hypothetical protein